MDDQKKDNMVIEIPHTFKIEVPQPLIEMFGGEEDATKAVNEMFIQLLPIMDNAFSTLLYPALIAMKSGVADESDIQKEVSKLFARGSDRVE